MSVATLLRQARLDAGMTAQELADQAGTARTAISAYENGRKSPTGDTLTRLLHLTGRRLEAADEITFHEVPGARGSAYSVPSHLPRLSPQQATRTVTLPLHVAWSGQRRALDLSVRSDRIRAYRAVLSEGNPDDILSIVDGALLIDAWPDLDLPRGLVSHWAELISKDVAVA